ncbi:MAG: FKBP-type peptidyl-prolyl cis-trans isomerase [Actinomycetes bacterium]
MRRPTFIGTAVVALSLTSAVVLSACGSSSAGSAAAQTSSDSSTPSSTTSESMSSSPSQSGSASGALPTVKGGYGQTPKVTMPAGDPPSELTTKVLVKGDGATVAKGDLAVVNYVGKIWKTDTVFDSSFDRGSPVGFAIGVGQVIPGWDKSLVGQTVGSRVLLVIPPGDGYGSTGNSQAGIAGDDTLVFVVDIVATHPASDSAKGNPTPPEDDSVPAVSVLPRKPDIIIPAGAAPPKLIAIPVVTGKGPVVKKGDLVVVQYVGKVWKTGKQFDSSWDRGSPAAFGIGIGQVIPGWDKGLVGQTVGSRMLLVIPPADGYGAAGQPSAGIGGTDTLVFAVDILGSYS